MSLFKLTLTTPEDEITKEESVPPEEDNSIPENEEVPSILADPEDDSEKLTSLNSISTEEEKIHVEDLSSDIKNDDPSYMCSLLWGGSIKNCVSSGNGEQPPPNFMIIQNGENVFELFIYCLKEQLGQFYQFLTNLEPGNVVTLHFFDLSPSDSITIQSAIKNSKATIKTKMYMCDADQASGSLFFTWMTGHVLLPVPYGTIALMEPLSPFSYASSTKQSAKQNYAEIDRCIKQNWYNYAIELGLITMEEMSMLNEGKVVFIEDINTRISNANMKKGKQNES